MWLHRAHILAPLTELYGSKYKFNWTNVHAQAFNLAKKLVSEDILLRFPNLELPFEIFTDASSFQIGTTIKQKNFTVAYFSKKHSPTQRRYSTIDQEMLAIVEVLHKYCNFLLGVNITTFTDHKKLIF